MHIKRRRIINPGDLISSDRNVSHPQSPNLCEPVTVSDPKVVGGAGTDVTCCQVGTKICCARLDQACWSADKQSSRISALTLSSDRTSKTLCVHVLFFFVI